MKKDYTETIKALEKIFWELDKEVDWTEESEHIGKATVHLSDAVKELRKASR